MIPSMFFFQFHLRTKFSCRIIAKCDKERGEENEERRVVRLKPTKFLFDCDEEEIYGVLAQKKSVPCDIVLNRILG